MSQGKPVEVVAFPKGFRMIAGKASKRKFFGPDPDPPMAVWTDADRSQQSLMEKSIGFNCLASTTGPIEGTLQRHYLPDRAKINSCTQGLRAEIQFPSCWDGVSLDSDNHTTHVAYPYMLRNGDCPEGYNTRLPTLLYETIYDTWKFKDLPGEFVFAQGDNTGNGYHGDFVNGWEEGVLDQAIAQCHDGAASGLQEDCKVLDIKPDSEVMTCKMEIPEVLQQEQVAIVDQLPGGCKIVADQDFVPSCGAEDSAPAAPPAPAPSSPPSPGPYSTPANSDIATIAPTGSQPLVNATPATTAVPSTDPIQNNGLITFASTTVVNGTQYNYVVMETVVTTTVTVSAGTSPAAPPPGAPGAVRRHLHSHSAETLASTKHGHCRKGRKIGRTAFW
jgi:hypothetical protein